MPNPIDMGSCGGGVGEHDILSDEHTDTFAADTPANGDVLTWVSANNRWEAVAGGSGSGVSYAWTVMMMEL